MNIKEIKENIDKHKIIFFDIFDTIVSRNCYPDYTKSIWCKYLALSFSLSIDPTELLKVREKFESELREKNKHNGYDPEFKYCELSKEMYSYLKNKKQIKVAEEEFCKEAELLEDTIEDKSQYVRGEALELLEYAKNNHKKIYCVSDMYLSKNTIKKIFKNKKILDYFDDIYISSEYLESKVTGNLYKKVIELNKFKVSDCLMIGNSIIPDYESPKKLGIDAVLVYYADADSFYNSDMVESKYKNIYAQLYNFKNENEDTFESTYNTYLYIEKLFFNNIKPINDNINKLFSNYEKNNLLNNKLEKVEVVYKNNHFVCQNITSNNIDINKISEPLFNNMVSFLENKLYSYTTARDLLNKSDNVVQKELTIREINKLQKVGNSYSELFYSFIYWILKSCNDEGIKKIYFFTREGEFFKDIADNINDFDIKKYVLEVSRIATFCPSLREVTLDEMMRLWNQYSVQSMKAYFKSVDLDMSKVKDLLAKYNIPETENIYYPWQDHRVIELFKDQKFIDIMQDNINKKRELILKYFDSKDLKNNGEKIAIVDIGWRGSIQDNLCYMLPKNDIYGYYFGLIDFLNKQPDNSHKQGYLNQYKDGTKYLNVITPFEMLCNSPNGSTIGYSMENGIHAIRKIDQSENNSYDYCTKYIQKGIIDTIKKNNFKYTTNGKEAFGILDSIIYTPSYYTSKAYFNLKHNEEFGLGRYIDKARTLDKKLLVKSIYSRSNRSVLREELINSTWAEGYLKYNNLGFTNNYFKIKNRKRDSFDMIKPSNKKKIAWFIPNPIKGSGGHRTFIQNANFLVKNGYECDLYITEDYATTDSELKSRLEKYFGECLCGTYVGAVLRKDYDLVFATHAVLTPDYVKNCNCSNKAYFIQDFEPWFVPMGESYLAMEESYKDHFKGVSIGNWLSYKLKKEYGCEVKSFPFCANLDIYKPIKDIEKEKAICFIYQPEKPRRCPNLGLKALKIVKKLRPDVKIYLYGSNKKVTNMDVNNLGLMSLNDCNELYNKCTVGLCISSSNPSRIPFEMMASGLPVVDLYKENNFYDMPDGGVLLADSTPESIATALIKIIDDKKLRDKMSKFGVNYMKDYPIERESEEFLKIVNSMFDKEYKNTKKIVPIYNNKMVEPSKEVLNVASIVSIVPIHKNTSDLVRHAVRIKKGIKRRIKL